MRVMLASAIIGLALTVSAASNAQAPAGSTGECKDGSYTTSESKRGACAAHGGVKDWYGAAAAKSSAASSAPAAAKASSAATSAAGPAPSGSTGECKDGTYTTAESKKGACAGHKGVKDWYGSTTPAKASAAPAAPTGAKATVAPMAPAAPGTVAKTSTAPTAAGPAAGGGPGQVWVNTNSKIYHCPGDKYYGKTKAGEYMTEAAAKAAGNRADHNKACS